MIISGRRYERLSPEEYRAVLERNLPRPFDIPKDRVFHTKACDKRDYSDLLNSMHGQVKHK